MAEGIRAGTSVSGYYRPYYKTAVISIWDMYFYPSLVHGEPQLRDRTKIRSDSLDITTLSEPWLSQCITGESVR